MDSLGFGSMVIICVQTIAMWDISLCCHCLSHLRQLWVEYMESHSSVSQPVGQEDPPHMCSHLSWLHNSQMGECVMDLCVHQVSLCLLAQNGVRFPVCQTAQSMHQIVPMMVLSYDSKKTKMKQFQCVAVGRIYVFVTKIFKKTNEKKIYIYIHTHTRSTSSPCGHFSSFVSVLLVINIL